MPQEESYHIVRLDGIHGPDPIFSPSFPNTLVSHHNTPHTELTIISRLTLPHPATICITTRIPITARILDACPSLKLVVAMAIGTDMIDLAACKARGIPVCNVPAASNESVAEHALALYFALRRNVVRLHELTVEGQLWGEKGSLKGSWVGGGCPGTCREEVVGVIGGGELGNRVATICHALGMKVQLAERKDISASSVRENRIPFTQCLRTSTIVFITLPLSPSTVNLISTPEFALMRSDAIIVNVARGGIVDEEALVKALEEKRIEGAATDVYLQEPATTANSLLVRKAKKWEGGEMNGRLLLSPHLAWWARSSLEKLRVTVAENIEAWARGEPRNLVV